MLKVINNFFRYWESMIFLPHHEYNLITNNAPKSFSIDDIFDGFLWGVPKHRRSIAIRIRRKHADNARYKENPRNDILTCIDCGHFHLKGCICENCYQKVKLETQQVLKSINPANRYTPIEHDIIIKYKDDPEPNNPMHENSKEYKVIKGEKTRVVEIDKPRPIWFHNNLLKKSHET